MAILQTRNHRLVAALALALVVAAGVAIFSLSDDGDGRKAALGDEIPGSVVYVAAGGRDTGTCASVAGPCATVTYALTKVNPKGTIKVAGTIKDNVTVTKDVTISGADAAATSPAVINGADRATVIAIPGRTTVVTLDRLRIEHGKAAAGGGINNAGNLTLTSTTITANAGSVGSGIYNNYGTLTVKNSTISGNIRGGVGGGLYTSYGPVTITDSTISGNTAAKGGGILKNDLGSSLMIMRSTISGNTAPGVSGEGGGIHGSGMTLIATTVTGNKARIGAAVFGILEVRIYSSTIAGNADIVPSTCTASCYRYGALFAQSRGLTFTIGGSIIAKNATIKNCQIGNTQPAATSLGHNLTDDDGTSCSLTLATDVRKADPLLGPLANNGGPTLTMLPAATSPVRNRVPVNTTMTSMAVSTVICPNRDQRNIARPRTSTTKCAIGSVEP